jgi:two-component system, NtrC family, sensor histidine kinase PilS
METTRRTTAQALTPITRLRAILDPRRALLWVHAVRTVLAVALIVSLPRLGVDQSDSAVRLVQAAAILALAVTGGSLIALEIYRLPIARGFLLFQAAVDTTLVTALVHVTGGGESPFAALYILVIAYAALLIPRSGGVLAALLVCAFYLTEVLVSRSFALDAVAMMQLGVFVSVAVGTGFVSARLRDVGSGSEQLAATLRSERTRASDVLDNIRSGVITVDGTGTLRYANAAASTLLRRELRPIVGTEARSALYQLAPGLLAPIERAIRYQVRMSRAETTLPTEDGDVPIGMTVTYSAGDGTPAGASATAIFTDISDAKRLEDLHLRAGRLEAISELSASLAHEIKNPLAAIQSAVEQLGRNRAADDDTRALTSLVVRESDRLSRLLTEFLDFSRVRVSRWESLDLITLLRDTVNLVQAHPERAPDVAIEVQADATLPIQGDDDLLHRAVLNLLLNGVQAVGASGRVFLEARMATPDEIPQSLSTEEGVVLVRIRDTGPGMTAEVRERIFTPFFTTKPRGSGLGLPVVHRAIEAHRGVLMVDSAPGAGATFTIVLPRTQSDAGAPA